MNILNIEHISKTFGDKTIFDDVSLGVHQGDKIGVLGVNGTGKSTLLKIIAGQETADEGEVIFGRGIRTAFLPQNPEFPDGAKVLSYVTEGKHDPDGNEPVSEAKTILTKLGICDFDESVDYLSGGQKKRAALARTLVDPADVLILDEPTNHIDNDMALWLEDYLNRFKGVLIMVTHDRYFLDRVTNKIAEIDEGKLYTYDSNYSGFLALKTQREEMELATERKRQSLLRTELEWVKRGPQGRGTKQKARLDRYEQLKNMEGPREVQNVEMDSVGTRLGKKTIELHRISKAYGEKELIKDFTYILLRDDRLGIIGPNGCGKSTLMKIITGRLAPDTGEVVTGDTVKIGYFAQENEDMEDGIRVIDYIRDVADYIQTPGGKISASQMLERFLFTPSMQYTPLSKLSGGEKRRLYLLKVLMDAPNVLVLDEPTNDLDIATLRILEDYLDSFQGIVLAVSHDRYFLDRIAGRIFAFEGGGEIKQYEGGYTDYLRAGKPAEEPKPKEKTDKKSWKQKDTRLKFSYKEQREYETIDEDIERLEEKIISVGQQMEENASQYTRLAELTEEKSKLEEQLNEKMERWVYLNDLAEKIESQNS
ncbi:ABC-F family ATP-binding cassette domain-containing protein [Anaerostipes caccae]|uniref:ABC-F family ATP-binding cassette domain-containing protein n=1 Tax=Anaerostipes caccae TaxID=105841 RepID=UPI00241D96D9|nr:ABC-F family ATP-binding cassette domain-containing protein [Anaerostipes caccae]